MSARCASAKQVKSFQSSPAASPNCERKLTARSPHTHMHTKKHMHTHTHTGTHAHTHTHTGTHTHTHTHWLCTSLLQSRLLLNSSLQHSFSCDREQYLQLNFISFGEVIIFWANEAIKIITVTASSGSRSVRTHMFGGDIHVFAGISTPCAAAMPGMLRLRLFQPQNSTGVDSICIGYIDQYCTGCWQNAINWSDSNRFGYRAGFELNGRIALANSFFITVAVVYPDSALLVDCYIGCQRIW